MKVIYKIRQYTDFPQRALVVKETQKQYKVKEWSVWRGHELAEHLSTWNKAECFESVKEAFSALIKYRKTALKYAEEKVLEKTKELEEANRWEQKEDRELKKIKPTL